MPRSRSGKPPSTPSSSWKARNFRLAAKAAEDNKGRLTGSNRALNILTEVIGTPAKAGGPIPKEKRGWGYASVEIRKEKATTLEEIARATTDSTKASKWAAAVQEWVAISKSFVAELPPYPEILSLEDKKLYRTEEEREKRAENSRTR